MLRPLLFIVYVDELDLDRRGIVKESAGDCSECKYTIFMHGAGTIVKE